MNWKNLRIATKLIIVMLIIGVASVATIGIFSYNQAKKSLEKRAYEQLTSLAVVKKTQIESFFNERVGDIKVLADNPYIKEAFHDFHDAEETAKKKGHTGKGILNDSAYNAALQRNEQPLNFYMKTYGYYDLFIIDEEGDIVYTVSKESDFHTDLNQENTHLAELWKNTASTKQAKLSDMEKYAPSNDAPAMFVAAPVMDNGEMIGVIALQIANDAINEIMQERSGLGESGETYLVGEDYYLRSDSRFSKDQTVLTQKVDTEGTRKALSGVSGAKVIKDYRGINVLSVFDKLELPGINWAIMAEIDESEVNQPVANLARIILITVGLIIIAIVIVAVFIARSFANPINKAVKFAQEVANGDLTATVDVDQKDEIGVLAKSLRGMVAKLKEIATNIRSGADYIASASQEMSSTSQEMSQGSNEQASSAEEVSSSMEEMASNIQQNTDNAQQTEKIALKAAEDIREGSTSVNMTVESMKQIADKIQIIGEIARQTNILALNAAVEAARAGEHGKGFAVVAAEVRKLAERSQTSANEIDELSKSSVSVAEKSGKLLATIVPDIEKTAKLVQEVSAASIEQNSGADQVNNAIQQLNQVTQQNAAASEELATSSEELSGQAEQLKDLIAFFKLGQEYQKSMAKKARQNVQNWTHQNSNTQKTASNTKAQPKKEKVSQDTEGITLDMSKKDNKDADFESF